MDNFNFLQLDFDEKNFTYTDLEKQTKFRGFMLQRSYDYERQQTNETEEQWKERITKELDYIYNNERVEYMLFIFHDSDLLEDGSIKPLHVHIIIKFKSPRYMQSVATLMRVSRSQNIQQVKSYTDASRYLIHVSEKALNDKKHIYSIADVTCFNCNIVDMMQRKGKMKEKDTGLNDLTANLGKQIRDGLITKDEAEVEIVSSYGETGWRRVRQSFDIDEEEYLRKLGKKAMIEGINRDLIYSSGPGGIGKSSTTRLISQHFMDSRGIHKVSAGGKRLTFDFAGTYNGEKVTIANDLDSSYFHYRDFFAMFDPYEYAPSKSRNKDKHWLAKKCFITNSKPLGQWVFDLIYYSEKAMQADIFNGGGYAPTPALSKGAIPMVWQALRRFTYWFDFSDTKIIVKRPTKDRCYSDTGESIFKSFETFSQRIYCDTLNHCAFEDVFEVTFNNLFIEQERVVKELVDFIKTNQGLHIN